MPEAARDTASLSITDALAAKGAKAPRVSIDAIKTQIRSVYYVSGHEALTALAGIVMPEDEAALKIFTLALVIMKNGFVLIGKSAPASPENYDRSKGELFAYEDAIRQLWPLEGYALRERLASEGR